ncbi:MAG: TraM recognition domain-containing protein, partial [Minisyncoccia bacterium]
GKFLIWNLSKGGLGEQNSNLLGLLLVSKLQMAAFKRNEIPEEQRRDFYLYLDEFQNFTTDSISTILSEARKYRLCLILANQYIGQLSDGIRNAVFGNVGTVVSFRISSDDAEIIAQRMQPYYTAEDLVSIDNLKGVLTLMINGKTSKAFNMEIIFANRSDLSLQQQVIMHSRQKYAKPVAEIRADIEHRTHSMLE